MNNQTFLTSIVLLPARARTSLALASAERVLPSLQNHPDVYTQVHSYLEYGWKWASGQSLSLQRLYEQLEPLGEMTIEFTAPSSAKYTLLAVIAALYYTTSEAATYLVPEVFDVDNIEWGSEMADTGEYDFLDALQKASMSVPDAEAELRWQETALKQLLRDFRTENPAQAGSPIPRHYFALV